MSFLLSGVCMGVAPAALEGSQKKKDFKKEREIEGKAEKYDDP